MSIEARPPPKQRNLPWVVAIPFAVLTLAAIGYSPLLWAWMTTSRLPPGSLDAYFDMALDHFSKNVNGMVDGRVTTFTRRDIVSVGSASCAPSLRCQARGGIRGIGLCGHIQTTYYCAYRLQLADRRSATALLKLDHNPSFAGWSGAQHVPDVLWQDRHPVLPASIDPPAAAARLCDMGFGCEGQVP
ncbi:MAG: hypothetical protein DI537_33660 [Stutzerimonas stutzeri]|nr:MAG: hypothetical protein DI537_33660 [Stutzerimonas stutzeri]